MIDRTLVPSQSFKLLSLEASEPPAMTQGANWYRYVIAQNHNRIEGYRQGPASAVNEAVTRMVEQMNERLKGKRGVPTTKPAPKKSPKIDTSKP